MSVKLGVSYFGVRNPDHVEHDLDRIKEAGCNVVLHTFSENDLRYYKETMHEIVKLSKEKGLEVYVNPWGVGGVFGGEAFTQYALKNDMARQVFSNGNLTPAACPNSVYFIEFVKKWINGAAKIGTDVILWDEPHFYLPGWPEWPKASNKDTWTCRCPSCQNLFQEQFDYSMPTKLNRDVEKFKDESIFRFIKRVMKYAKSKGLTNAICLLPEWDNLKAIEQKWEKYARLESLDIFGSDPYWMLAEKTFSESESHARVVRQLANRYKKEPQLWVQAFSVKAGNEKYVSKAVRSAYQLGIENIMAWSYLGTAYMSRLKPERPEKVWQALKEAFLAIREKETS